MVVIDGSAFVFSADLHVLCLCSNPKRARIRKNICKDYDGDGGRFPVEELAIGEDMPYAVETVRDRR
jgi:hypothetical protein